MNFKNFFTLLLLTCLMFLGCQKKTDLVVQPIDQKIKNKNIPPKGFFIENIKVPGVVPNNGVVNPLTSASNNSANQSSSPDPDNGDDPIVLGQQLANPYTVAHMQQAVNVLYGGNYTISATHLYVRFKPSSVEQFITLEETEDLELQDYPMDYEIIQDGDYYQDPSQGTEDFQWLYTVVQVGYNFPPGIQMEVIESLYLPNDNEILEDMAESMVAGAQYSSARNSTYDTVHIDRLDAQSETFNYTGEQCPCSIPDQCPVWPDCGLGGGGGGGGNDPKIPRGIIEVQDIRTCATPITNVPVRQARIVCRRWFKIDRTYTNDQGQFVSSKKFKNKVKVLLKTKNQHAKVSKIRGIRLWQILFPVKKRIGVFDEGAMANIPYLFVRPASASANDKELPYWVAATTHNSVLEYRQYAAEFGIALPPNNLKLLISNWADLGFRAIGAAPMFNKCGSMPQELNNLGDYFRFLTIGYNTVYSVVLASILKNQTDLLITYSAPNGDYNCRLTSRDLKAITYHELGHASHFVQAGCGYWQDYRSRIAAEIAFGNANTKPYGNGTENNAGVVGVGEMWGSHCEFIFINRHYGNGGGAAGYIARIQGFQFTNSPAPPFGNGLNAYLNAIENFNPTINQLIGTPIDPHQWLPQGLPFDLIDDRNDFNFNNNLPVDNVSGYTTQNCFNALQTDVRSVPAFRDRLLQQNGNNQAANVIDLFFRYGY